MTSRTTIQVGFRVPDQYNPNGKDVGEEYWVMHDIIERLLTIPGYKLTEHEADVYNRVDNRVEAKKQRLK